METIGSRTLKEQTDNINGNGDTHITATAISSATVDLHHNSTHSETYFGGVSEIIEIIEEDEEILMSSSSSNHYSNIGKPGRQRLVPISEGGIETNTTSLFSIDIHNNSNNNSGRLFEDVIYVAVGKSESSMDALQWTLKHSVKPGSTLVYLIHIFSDLKFIPSPFGGGMVPKAQVSPDLVENHMAQDTRKRRELLTKYVDKCTSHMVQVETILIESDSVANAIVELISVLNIRQLVIGISKSNLRKVKVGKGSAAVAEQIRQKAQQGFELKIVCQGKQINESSELYFGDHIDSPSTASLKSLPQTEYDEQEVQPKSNNSFSCCFKA